MAADGPSGAGPPPPPPAGAEALGPVEALHWLQTRSGHPLWAPVGAIDPNETTQDTLAVAQAVDAILVRCGLTLLCGGRQGGWTRSAAAPPKRAG